MKPTGSPKTCDKVLSSTSVGSKAIKRGVKNVQSLFLEGEQSDSRDSLRVKCVVEMGTLVKSPEVAAQVKWQRSVVRFLLLHSYFDVSAATEDTEHCSVTVSAPISDKLRLTLQNTFRKSLQYVSRIGSTSSKHRLTCEADALLNIIQFTDCLMRSRGVVCINSTAEANWKRFFPWFEALAAKSQIAEEAEEKKPFIILYSLFALHMLDEPAEALTALQELHQCQIRAFSKKQPEQSDEPFWADVVTDLIISLLPNSSHFLRTVLISAFGYICSHITSASIGQLHDALVSSSLDGEDDGDDDDDDDEDEAEGEGEENEVSSESEEEEDEPMEEDADEDLRSKLAAALGMAAAGDEEEDSDVYLSDSEMFKLDDALAEAFRSQVKGNKGAKMSQQTLLEFKARCLDMIRIILGQREVSASLVLQLIPSILSVTRSFTGQRKQSNSNQIVNKATQIIAQIPKVKNYKMDVKSEDMEVLKSLFASCLKTCSKYAKHELQTSVSSLCAWIITVAKKIEPVFDWHLEGLTRAITDYFQKSNCHYSNELFASILNIHSEIAPFLLEAMKNIVFNEKVRGFKRASGLSIFLLALRSSLKSPQPLTKSLAKELLSKSDASLISAIESDSPKLSVICPLLEVSFFMRTNYTQLSVKQKEANQTLGAALSKINKKQKRKLGKKGRQALNRLVAMYPVMSMESETNGLSTLSSPSLEETSIEAPSKKRLKK